MPQIPAVCNTCSAVFPAGIEFENVFEASLKGVRAGPCPKCGGWGAALDGVYNALGDTLQIFVESDVDRDQLKALLDALIKARDKGEDAEEISKEAEKIAPTLAAPLVKLFRSQANRIELYAVLSLVIAWLTYAYQNPDKPLTQNNTVNIINRCMVKPEPAPAPEPTPRNRAEKRAAKSRARHK